MKRTDFKDRCEAIALFVIEEGATVRQAAHRFSISKSTVHKDLTTKLRRINKALYLKVKAVLEKNKSERHLRGGEATRKKYLKAKSSNGAGN